MRQSEWLTGFMDPNSPVSWLCIFIIKRWGHLSTNCSRKYICLKHTGINSSPLSCSSQGWKHSFSSYATAGCLNHPLPPTSPVPTPWILFLLLSFDFTLLFPLSLSSSLDLCSFLFAILLVPVVKEVWLPTVCCHSFFQTRIRHPGTGCMLSSGGTSHQPPPSPWLSPLPRPPPVVFLSIRRHQCNSSLGCGSVNKYFLLCPALTLTCTMIRTFYIY